MAKCPKAGSGCCTCGVKKKRKATARRPPPAPVTRGQVLTILGGTEQQYVNSLMANLQRGQITLPGATTIGLPQAAERVVNAPPLAPVMPRATATAATETEARPTGRNFGVQTYGMQVLRRPQAATTVGETQTEQPRTRPYRGGIMGVLNQVVAPSALAQQVRAIGATEGYARGIHAGQEVGAAAAIEGLRFTQTAGTAATYTVPELQARFAEGQILRVPGGRPRADVQAVAEAAAPK